MKRAWDSSAWLAQAEMLAAGELGAVELLGSTLRGIEVSQPSLNAFRRLCPEQAMADARQAEGRLAAGRRLPLLGVPIAIKDDMDLAGEPTAFGCPGEFAPCREDGEVARRLRAAGAVIVGKTNTPEIGQWPFTEGPAFGATRNPWSPAHSPGDLWLLDYFPVSRAWMTETHQPLEAITALLPGAARIEIRFEDREDASLAALESHPRLILDPRWRRQTSYFERLARDHFQQLQSGLRRLRSDIEAGQEPSGSGRASLLLWRKA